MTVTTATGWADVTQGGVLIPEPAARHRLSQDFRAGAYTSPPAVFGELLDAEDRLQATYTELLPPVEQYAELLWRLGQNLLAGQPLPEDLGAVALASVDAERARTVGINAVGVLQQHITTAWEAAARKHADDLLAQLRTQLEDLVTEIRSNAAVLATLELDNFEAVLAATDEQRAAITALKALRPQYRRLRLRQQRMLETAAAAPVAYSTWAGAWQRRIHEFSRVGYIGIPEERLDGLDWFVPIASRDDVWLPSIDDLFDACTAVIGY